MLRWPPSMLELKRTVRRVLRAPRRSAAIVATLGLALGATSAIFAMVDAVLWRPLPMRAPDELVLVWESAPSRDLRVVELSHGNTRRWTGGATSLRHAAALGSSLWPAVLQGRGEPVRVGLTAVGGGFFETLGTTALHGRLLAPADDVPGATAVTVVAHGAWQRLLGADPGVVGTTLQLDRPRLVVGVAPRELEMPKGTDFWTPVVPTLTDGRPPGLDILEEIGVLFATIASATAELESRAAASPAGAAAGARFGERIVVTPLLDHWLGPLRPALWIALAASVVLLLIASVNVSSLLLGAALVRVHDDATQLALGARPRDLRRQWRGEVLVLSGVAAAIGLAVAWLIVRLTVALAPSDIPRLGEVHLGWRATVAMFAALAATTMYVGRRVSSVASASSLASIGPGERSTPSLAATRRRMAMVTWQVLLSVLLLGATGLVLRGLGALHALELGFVPTGATAVFVGAPTAAWMDDLLDRLRTSTRIDAAGAVSLRPLELGPIGSEAAVVLAGQIDGAETRRRNPTLNHLVVSPGYFEAMRTPVLAGRWFVPSDDERAAPVAIVGATAARRLWPGREAVGQRLLLPTAGGSSPPWRTVVGVVADIHYRGIGDPRLDVYEPHRQSEASGARHLVVRSELAPADIAALVRTEARRLAPTVVVDQVQPLSTAVAHALQPWRFAAWVLGAFAIAGVTLASVGLFGVVGVDVTARRRELAVRAALGAEPHDLLWHVLAPVLSRVAIGTGVGIAAATIVMRGVRGLLAGVGLADPLTWTLVIGVVLVSVTIAVYGPARMVLRLTPSALLRDQ
jgi:putative ABC transport system permease protein